MRATRCSMLVLAGLALAGCGWGGKSPGERIYADGVGAAGPIAYTQGPDWLRFAGGGCAVCHGSRGQGLTMQAGGVAGVAPPVSSPALEARGYDEHSLRRALTDGVDPHGREFHYYMPRWELEEADMDALFAYLGTL